MDFGVKRLHTGSGTARLYHLYDKWDRLRFVADHGSPWLADNPHHYVRLARTDGHLVATLNLPWGDVNLAEEKRPLNYAVLVDHAVYAVFEVYEGKRPLIVLEVEESRWLVAPDGDHFNLFDNAPSSFRLRTGQAEEIAAPPIGRLLCAQESYDFVLALPGKRPLRRPAILSLALTVLIDKFNEIGD